MTMDQFSAEDRIRKRKQKLAFATFVLLSLLITGGLPGCSWLSGRKSVENAHELAEKGMESFENEDYDDAIKAFTTLKERYP